MAEPLNRAKETGNCILPEALPLRERVRRAARQIESEIILDALEKHRWNRRRTAEALRISYRSLMYKMKNCNLQGEEDLRGPGIS